MVAPTLIHRSTWLAVDLSSLTLLSPRSQGELVAVGPGEPVSVGPCEPLSVDPCEPLSFAIPSICPTISPQAVRSPCGQLRLPLSDSSPLVSALPSEPIVLPGSQPTPT